MMNGPIQKILFGSPGTGKSHRIKNNIAPKLGVDSTTPNYVSSVFHPEYTYGDFVGKLMPFSDDNDRITYQFYRGHFIKALAKAYKNIIDAYLKDYETIIKDFNDEHGTSVTTDSNPEVKQRIKDRNKTSPQNVILVIDEINRGNSSAIFGSVFQLLDREKNGWSSYPVTLSDLEYKGLLKEMTFLHKISYDGKGNIDEEKYIYDGKKRRNKDRWVELQDIIFEGIGEQGLLTHRKIKIPPNLSIVATMNTSDNSIYFMDSAFKRRWQWEFANVEDDNEAGVLQSRHLIRDGEAPILWIKFVDKINEFIRSNHAVIRKIEDKQIGYFFINEDEITVDHIKNKLMFFIWDSVFSNNKEPLVELLWGKANRKKKKGDLATFGQFTKDKIVKRFIKRIVEFDVETTLVASL